MFREAVEEQESTEITLGTGKLLGLFVGLVVICAIFFSLGYALGKNSVGPQLQMTDAPATLPSGMTAGPKPGAGTVTPAAAEPVADTSTSASTSAPASDTPEQAAPPTAAPMTTSGPQLVAAKQTDAAHALPAIGAGIVVQVAAVSKRGDADILINALRQKGYPVILANGGLSPDNLYHVQVGPFSSMGDAELTKGKLASDGYSPIIKR